MIVVRSLIFNVVFYSHMVTLLIVGLPALLMPRRAVYLLGRTWARNSLWLLEKICNTRVEFRGFDKLPKSPYIVASKHQSMWETFALIMMFDDFCYILKKELTYIPFFGWYLWKADQIAIDRSKGSSVLTQIEMQARNAFAQGRTLFIFPEGTRRPAGAPPKYKFGIAHIYSACNVACVPIALNSGLFWARRSWIRRPGTIVVEALEPIHPGVEQIEFFESVQLSIETATNKLMDEAVEIDPSLDVIVSRNRNVP